MYVFRVYKRKTEKKLYFIKKFARIRTRLHLLRINPRRNSGAHKLKGKHTGKWSCVLGSDLRMMYIINDEERIIEVLLIGSHNIYKWIIFPLDPFLIASRLPLSWEIVSAVTSISASLSISTHSSFVTGSITWLRRDYLYSISPYSWRVSGIIVLLNKRNSWNW